MNRLLQLSVLALSTGLGIGCTSKGDGTSGPGDHPAIALALSPTSGSVTQGSSTTVTATLTRSGGFTGDVLLTVTGAPAGVSGAVSNVQTASGVTTGTITVTVDATTVPGTYALTAHGTGAGVTEATATYTLTVLATPAYTLSLNPSTISIAQNTSGTVTVTIGRTNYAGAVTLALQNAPNGVTGSFNPAAPSGAGGTSSILTIAVGASVPVGQYLLTVHGIGASARIITGSAAAAVVDQSVQVVLTVTAAPDYSLSLTPAALSITQGANTPTTTVTITRTNDADPVTLSLGNAPANVTGVFAPNATTGTTSVLTISVGASVPPGVYNLSVNGASGVGNRSTALTLTVVASADFSLSLTAPALSIVQGASTPTTTVTITRVNFSGAVTLTLLNAPANVSGSFNPAAPTTTASVLTIAVGASVTPGVYNLTVQGAGTPGTRTTALTLTVTSSGGGPGNVTVDFSNCVAASKAVWLAFQDDVGGGWSRVTGVNDVYHFTITQPRGGVAFVTLGTGTSAVNVFYYTKDELTAAPLTFCGAATGNTINGAVAGISLGEAAAINLGGRGVLAFADGPVQITGVQPGTNDLVGYKHPVGVVALTDRMLFMRNLSPANLGSFGTADFNGGGSFPASFATMTINGTIGGETVVHGMNYFTGTAPNACTLAALYSGMTSNPAGFPAYGAPGAQQLATDYHSIAITAINGATGFRTLQQDFHTLAPMAFTLGSSLSGESVTSLGGPTKRLQMQLNIPAEYQSSATFTYNDVTVAGKTVLVTASFGWLGSGAFATLGVQDFSGVAGFQNSWLPASGDAVNWAISVTGTSGTACTDGHKILTAVKTGSA